MKKEFGRFCLRMFLAVRNFYCKIAIPFDVIRKFQFLMGRVPAFGYLFLYILMIPSFAWYYSLISTNFYHSSARYESHIYNDAMTIREMLNKEYRDAFVNAHGGSVLYSNGWRFDVDKSYVYGVKVKEGLFTAKMRAEFLDESGVRLIGAPITLLFEVRLTYAIAIGSLNDLPKISIKSLKFESNNNWPIKAEKVFDLAKDNSGRMFLSPAIPISMDLQNKIIAFSDAVRGFPNRSSGTYNRMLYLSAVTITTLGYGDIVPISDQARTAVALESVLGILLIGLFLNSLFTENTLRKKY